MSNPFAGRGSRVLILIVLVAISGSIVFVCLPREPSYHGKPFTYWLDQLPGTLVSKEGSIAMTSPAFSSASQEAKEALDAIGPKGLHTLMARLRYRDSKIKSALQRLAVRLGLLKPAFLDLRRAQALTAIIRLDERASPLVPDLLALTQSDDLELRVAALHALRNIAPGEYRRLRLEDGWVRSK